MSNNTVDYIRQHITPYHPQTLIILGSGLGNLGEKLQEPIFLAYQDIPDFPHSTVQGHGGRLICGRLGEREVLCMQGRFHLYEGHKPQTIHQLFAWFKELGIKELMLPMQSRKRPRPFSRIVEFIVWASCPLGLARPSW